VVARLSNVFNGHSGSPDFLSEWLKKATLSREIILDSSPGIQRDYIHLDDAVASLKAIAGGSGIYNVACGQLISNGEIAEIFKSEGWSVTFTGVAEMQPPPSVSVERLSALGIKARSVKDVLREFLRGLKF
jgi:nucleoside-diphosphate-sugar epimerase